MIKSTSLLVMYSAKKINKICFTIHVGAAYKLTFFSLYSVIVDPPGEVSSGKELLLVTDVLITY